jgi:hypothetical protein
MVQIVLCGHPLNDSIEWGHFIMFLRSSRGLAQTGARRLAVASCVRPVGVCGRVEWKSFSTAPGGFDANLFQALNLHTEDPAFMKKDPLFVRLSLVLGRF